MTHSRPVPLLALAAAVLTAAALLPRLADPARAAAVPLDPVVSSPLGDEALTLTEFHGVEELSRLFTYQLDVISADDTLTAGDLLGSEVTVSISDGAAGRRHFNGMVSRLVYLGPDSAGMSRYRLEMVPRLWWLTQAFDSRVFAEMSVPEVIAAVLAEYGGVAVDDRLDQPHPTRECAVQYRETDFNFVSRLMEDEGIHYFFEHDGDGHTLVLADDNGAARPVAADVPFSTEGEPGGVDEWTRTGAFVPGRVTLTDYDFTRPRTDLTVSADARFASADPATFEIYEYPGGYADRSEGERLARLRMEEAEATFDAAAGTSTVASFGPGGTFTLGSHPRPDQEGPYLLTGTTHRVVAGDAGEPTYENAFTAVPVQIPYRPPRITPRPAMQGPQTAVVVPRTGEEIYPDEYGRVKVRFHWDREGAADDSSSCWVRVAQLHAGRGWGVMQVPRVGSEVLVDFLEGDPDRPLIVGRVYNAQDVPPRRLWR